jgi:hypothetical protein
LDRRIRRIAPSYGTIASLNFPSISSPRLQPSCHVLRERDEAEEAAEAEEGTPEYNPRREGNTAPANGVSLSAVGIFSVPKPIAPHSRLMK